MRNVSNPWVVLIASMILFFLSGCAPSYRVSNDLIEIIPKELAVDYLNENMTRRSCRFSKTGVSGRDEQRTGRGVPRTFSYSYEEIAMRYVVTEDYRGGYWLIVHLRPGFGQGINECVLAAHNNRIMDHDVLVQMLSALQSLGATRARLNALDGLSPF